ncbi:CbrC family protein [Salmonella enterica]|nr:CbrC family protein [Salmonella enterica]
MERALPQFTYVSDEYVKIVFVKTTSICDCCKRESHYRYSGPIYMTGDNDISLCPWCIHDGSAAKKYQASFNEIYGEELAESVITKVCEQTPGYNSWQDQSWATHCNDACVYHGDATSEDVAEASAQTRQQWMRYYEQDAESWSHFMKDYRPGGDQGVYKFICRHCGLVVFNWDFS